MKATRHSAAGILLSGLLSVSCSSNPKPTVPLGDGPYSFHDTRLRYAILTDDRRALANEFSMTTEPTLPERIAAVFALPVASATEVAVWPAASAFRAFYESE